MLRVGFPDRLMNKENNRAGLYNRFVKMITIKTLKNNSRPCNVPTAEDDGWSREIKNQLLLKIEITSLAAPIPINNIRIPILFTNLGSLRIITAFFC